MGMVIVPGVSFGGIWGSRDGNLQASRHLRRFLLQRKGVNLTIRSNRRKHGRAVRRPASFTDAASQIKADQRLLRVLLPQFYGPIRRGGKEHVRMELVPLDAAKEEG